MKKYFTVLKNKKSDYQPDVLKVSAPKSISHFNWFARYQTANNSN
ncbi:hypothetical protein ACVCDT_00460 [Paraglaciecola aestuariivivens]